jgi:pimeloyl-ACP methyl ester carboxylesterase
MLSLLFSGANTESMLAQNEAPEPERSGLLPSQCPMTLRDVYDTECGILIVPEDHTKPNSPSIQIAVAIVHSPNDNPAPDPILFIDGGPGSRTLDSMTFWLGYLDPFLLNRDIIFFDQRGTGYSEPALECPETWDADSLEEVLRSDRIIACRDRLLGMGIDLKSYNSVQSAADINLLRQALGYESWNLYGISYGTRVALTAIRDYPEGVSSALLDAVWPLEASPLDDLANSDSAFQKLFAACEADFLCRTVYPDLGSVYQEAAGTLVADPVTLKITNPKTGTVKFEILDGAAFNGFVIESLAMPLTSGAPGLIYEVRAGSYESIVASMESELAFYEDPEIPVEKSRAAIGLQLSVLCNEEFPYISPTALDKTLATYPPNVNMFSGMHELFYEACSHWGFGPVNPTENAPVISDVPILILASEYDAARSPTEAYRVGRSLPNGDVIEFPGMGHGTLFAGTCPLSIMESFLNDPTILPDTSCISEMPTDPEFYITVNPTRPLAVVLSVFAGIIALIILISSGVRFVEMAKQKQILWRASLRQVGWKPVFLSAGLSMILFLLMPLFGMGFFYDISLAIAIVIVVPFLTAIKISTLVAPGDEPGVEIIMACPRPLQCLFAERIVIVFAGQSLIALILMGAAVWILGEEYTLAAFIGWLPSTLFLSGLAIFSGIHSRNANTGVLIALLTWLVFGTTGSKIMDILPAVPFDAWHIPWPRPMGLIQPFIWMFHPFLRPDSLTSSDFILNRLIVAGTGLILLALALDRLKDSEWVLLGRNPVKKRKTGTK